MKLENQNILIISNEPWGDIWYSKQNYAYELSKLGNQVIFVDPPSPYQFKNLFFNRFTLKNYTDNLSILSYKNRLPASKFNVLNNQWVTKDLENYLLSNGIKEYILWTFDPVRLNDPSLFKHAKYKIFHCVDIYKFEYYPNLKKLLAYMDVMFSTAQSFIDEYKHYTKAPMKIVPHGISSDEFTISEEEFKAFDIHVKDYHLYVGVIDARIDYELLDKLLKQNPNEKFVFIGPLRLPNNPLAHKIFTQKIYDNLIIAGPKHFKKLKVFIYFAKSCLALMDKNYFGNLVHHHKTLVYLAQGKPVFSVLCEAYQDLKDLMYLYDNHEELLHMFAKFLNNSEDPQLTQKRIEYAKKYSFENILRDASNILHELTPHLS
jgi:hypothetical protein